MWPRYGSTVNSAHSNTILENSVFETYGLLSMVPYDTGGRVAITIWSIWGINPSFEHSKIQKYYITIHRYCNIDRSSSCVYILFENGY